MYGALHSASHLSSLDLVTPDKFASRKIEGLFIVFPANFLKWTIRWIITKLARCNRYGMNNR